MLRQNEKTSLFLVITSHNGEITKETSNPDSVHDPFSPQTQASGYKISEKRREMSC